MAARSIWNGTITFGAVAIPVKLFSATDTRTLSFKEVRAEDGARVSHKRIGATSGEEVAYADIEKGFDTGDELVILSKEEVSAADGTRPKLIEIERFVKGEQIDPVFYDKAYHLGAGKGGERGYRVLLAALEKSGRVGIGRLVLRSREQLVALRPIHGALGLQTMRFHDELVEPGDLELPEMKKAPGEKEVTMAGKLVEMLAGAWDPDAHRDTYRDAVLELIEAKAGGKDVTIAPAKQPAQDGDALSKALEASLAALEDGGGSSKPSKAKSSSSTKAKSSSSKRSSSAKSKGSSASTSSSSSTSTSSSSSKSSSRSRRSPTEKPGPPKASARSKKGED